MKIKGKVGDQIVEAEISDRDLNRFRKNQNETPHVHHSKAHPSANEKCCDGCGKMVVSHYHFCEDCFKFLKESLILKIRELEKKVETLEKKQTPS